MRISSGRTAIASVTRLATAFWKLPSRSEDHDRSTAAGRVTPPSLGPILIASEGWFGTTARFHALASGSASSNRQKPARTDGRAKESRRIGSEPEIDEGLERYRHRPRNRQHIDDDQRGDGGRPQPVLRFIGALQRDIQ